MASITLRSVKGSALTFAEGDANFSNLNTDKVELTDLSVTTGSASGAGALSYSNLTGVFSFAPADLSSYLTGITGESIGDLSDVTLTSPSMGQVLTYGGSGWINVAAQTELANDTTPQLSGELVCQGNVISDPTLKDYKETIHSLGSTDTPSISISNGNVQSVTITSGLTLPAFSDAAAGQSVTLLVTGSGNASGVTGYKFAGGSKTLTNFSVVSIFYDGTTYWTSIATDFQV